MDPKTKYYTPAYQKTLATSAKLLDALEKAPDGLRSEELITLLGYSKTSSVYNLMSDLNLRLLEGGSPFRVKRYTPQRVKGRSGQTFYKLEPRRKP